VAEGEVLTPTWWVQRLYAQLTTRNARTKRYARYYKGEFDLPWLPSEAEVEFKRILRMTRSNYMGLVIDAMVERMNLVGFRLGSTTDGMADKDMWRIWTYNNLDSFHDQGLLEAAIHSCFYYLVAPNKKDSKNPLIFIEHPSQAIVEFEPGTNRRERAAGLKAWIDDWTGRVNATLYTPDSIYKFQAKDPQTAMQLFGVANPSERELLALTQQWQRRIVKNEDWPARNPFGEVPLIESPNNPRLLVGGVSEIADLVDVQDRICKTIADRLMTQDYGAFPLRWVSGWPKEDEQGNENQPVDVGRTRFLSTDVAESRFGQFDAAPLDPYSAAKREDVIDIASRSRTPPHYLIAGMSNVNGETLKASESGLTSKCNQRMSGHSDPAQDVARLTMKAAEKPIPDDERIEVMWANPEVRTRGETTDAVVKERQGLELPLIAAWERVGASPTEIVRWTEMRDKERKEMMQNDPAMLLAQQYRDQNGAAANGGAPAAAGGAPRSGTQQKNGAPAPGAGRPASDPQRVAKPNGVTR
jgi:hypothetical protein